MRISKGPWSFSPPRRRATSRARRWRSTAAARPSSGTGVAAEFDPGATLASARHPIDAGALATYLRTNVGRFDGALCIEQFQGGQSNPTYRVTAGARRYVLRRKPPGHLLPSAHAVEREFRVLSALAGSEVPVPRTFA